MLGAEDSWEIYQDKRGEYRWRRKAPNGKITGASCEGYTEKSNCVSNANRHGMDANPKDMGLNDRWEVYKDKRNHFRWRRMARNGQVTGASSESYISRAVAKDNAIRNGMRE